jgi:integrase
MSPEQTMVDRVEDYLEHRRRLGYVLRGVDHQLRQFARYADASGHRGPVTVELAVQWAKLPEGAKPQWWATRLGFVRAFAKHRCVFEPETQVPPAGLLGPSVTRCTPHIYSDAEISALLAAAAMLGPGDGLRPHTYVTLLGLLVSSGLRISEARHLTRADVDFEAGVLAVRQTKFRKSRLVPLHPSTVDALRRYASRRDRYHASTTVDNFFLNELGGPLGESGVAKTFGILRRQLGWTKGRGGRRPRVHDLRHTMAVRVLLRWIENGDDIGGKIAALATYLGHVEVTDTYWYLTAVPQLMALTAARFESYGADGARKGGCNDQR